MGQNGTLHNKVVFNAQKALHITDRGWTCSSRS